MDRRKQQYQSVFRQANSRLADLPEARCREVEMAHLRALRQRMGPNPMVRELWTAMKGAPAGPEWRDRLHHTLRRVFVALERSGASAEEFQTAVNATLDGQVELAERWLDANLLLRPWGER